jgi:hypothetical protein
MVAYDLETVISRLQNDVIEMQDFITAIESYIYSEGELSSSDLGNLSGKLFLHNHPKYFQICEYLDDLAAKNTSM